MEETISRMAGSENGSARTVTELAAIAALFTGGPAEAVDPSRPVLSAADLGAWALGQGYGTHGDDDASRAKLEEIKASGSSVMVFPYSVEAGGISLVYIGGEYSHAFGRDLAAEVNAEPVEGRPAEVLVDAEPTDAERAVAEAALKPIDPANPPLYVRIDIVRTPDGAPVILEVQVVQPDLHLERLDGGAEKFAQAVLARIAAEKA